MLRMLTATRTGLYLKTIAPQRRKSTTKERATLPGAGVKARRIKKAAPRTGCAALKRQKSSSENRLCHPKVAKKKLLKQAVPP